MKSQCACVRVQSASSLPDGSYRGGRKKEPPPPNMTAEQRMMWEQERDKKDKHNDSELAMTMSVCVCCYSARHPVTTISTLLHCKQTFLTTASIIFRRHGPVDCTMRRNSDGESPAAERVESVPWHVQ